MIKTYCHLAVAEGGGGGGGGAQGGNCFPHNPFKFSEFCRCIWKFVVMHVSRQASMSFVCTDKVSEVPTKMTVINSFRM